jgi:DNA invertase Pin-like site-specific DNA recombinase
MANALVVHKDRLPQSQKMHLAAQYVRMSTDQQKYSIENQAVAIAAYAQVHNLTIIRTYRDAGESGLKIENRTGLIELIEDVQSGRNDFGNLLVFDVSRWGRFQDVDESAHYEFICRKAGVKVAYCSEQFENDGSLLSSIVKNIKRVMAAEYSRELSAKVHAGALRLARSGYKMGGPATYGLQRQLLDEKSRPKGMLARGERKCLLTDRVRLHPGEHSEAEVVKWTFDEYVKGKTQAAIARELNARGISAARGGLWHKNAIGMLLRNEAYIGTYIYNRVTEKLGTKRTNNPQELWIRSEGAFKPLIGHDVFLRARKAMEERRIRISEEEMLRRLRKVLVKRGALSGKVIRETRGLPGLATYLVHFGTLRNIYRLIGYTGNQGYWDTLAIHQRWVDALLKDARRLAKSFDDAGRRTLLDPDTQCLQIDGSVNIFFQTAKRRKYDGHSACWTLLLRRVRPPPGWTVIARLAENNEMITDYLLMPSELIPLKSPVCWLSKHPHDKRKECFKTFSALSRSLVKRICVVT